MQQSQGLAEVELCMVGHIAQRKAIEMQCPASPHENAGNVGP